jgi:hypothetical protein
VRGKPLLLCASLTKDLVQTLERILAPNISHIVALTLQAPSPPTLHAGVDILLVLAERSFEKQDWNSETEKQDSWRVWDSVDHSDTLYSQCRGEVYRSIQVSLQANVACQSAVGFTHILMTKMKGLSPMSPAWQPTTNGYSIAIEASRPKADRADADPNWRAKGGALADKPVAGTTRELQPIAQELLRCFIKPRWNNPDAVQLLLDLVASPGERLIERGYQYSIS